MSGFGTLAALAWRESRFARRRLFLFLSAISLGVAALVATRSFATNMAAGVREQARELLGADLAFSSTQPFGDETEAVIDSLQRAGGDVARSTSFASMVLSPPTGSARLAQIRGIEPGYPFYGRIETQPAGAWSRMRTGRVLLADPSLLVALGIAVGDSVRVGQATFEVAGTLTKVPGEAGISSAFAPRAYIPARHVEDTGLLRFGSRVEREAFVRLDAPPPGEQARQLRERLRPERVSVRTAESAQQRLGRALERLGSFLGLIGTFALLLGGIGVASAMAAYMAEKRESIATLRCLGATAPQVLGIYLVQAAAMGLAGSLLGATLGAAVQWVLPRMMADLLPVEVRATLDPSSLAIGIGVGVAVAMAFALLPLLETRRISPLQALRRRVEPDAQRPDAWSWAARLLLAAVVVLLVLLQAGDLETGLQFTAGIAVALLALSATAWAAVRATRRLRVARLPYTVRQGVANLYRPGNQTRTVVLALGFGVFLLAVLYLVQSNLLRPLQPGTTARANLVLFDVQADQEPSVREMLRARGSEVVQRAPIVPMRIASVKGRGIEELAPRRSGGPPAAERDAGAREERGPDGWALRREYRSTYRDSLVGSEALVEGRWPAEAGPDGEVPVSLEEGIAEDLSVGVGDPITWDVQGVRIPSRVASIRAVDWARLEPNFFALFPTRALRDAPQTWVLMADAPDPDLRARLQAEIVARHPNVAVVDLTQVQASLDEVFGRVAAVIRFLAAFSIATGFIVLLGAVAVSRLQRIRESVLLRTLGASRGQVTAVLLTEYAALGLLAALSGILLSVIGGWALARWVFQMDDFSVPLPALAALAALVALLAAGVGGWAGLESFRRTPLEALRED